MRILVFCLPGIGDALMATPMIRVLKQEIPAAKIEVAVMFDSVAYLFKNNRSVDATYYLPIYKTNRVKGVFRILPLRKYHYDISVLAYPAFRREYHIVQWLGGSKRRLAHKFAKGYWSECNFLDSELIEVDEEAHNVINNLNLVKLLGINWEKKYKKEDFGYELVLDKEDMSFGDAYLSKLGWDKKHVVGLHPGSINSPAGILKRWPIDRFAKVAKHLITKRKKVLIFFGPFEVELGRRLNGLINDPKNCQPVIENTKFKESLGILASLRMLITNDNGFAHLANALSVQTLVLFGPTNMNWCGPYDAKLTINIRKASFTPWFRNDMKVTNPPRGAESGMEEITANDVIERLDNVW